MRTTRAVVGAVVFGVVILVALGGGAMSIGVYGGTQEDGLIRVEGDAVLGGSVVVTGDGFGPAAVIAIEIAANADDEEALVAHLTEADSSGNVRFTMELAPPLTAGTWVMAMHGQAPDGATRVLWERTFVVSAPEPVRFCKGEVATHVGTEGSTDPIVGTDGPDVIVGTSGPDVIHGLGGDDLICAGAGDDEVRGGTGADRIYGQSGADQLRGNGDADVIKGGSGPDRIWGGRGNDRLRGNGDADVIKGGAGRDNIKGGAGADDLRGNGGRDRIRGNKGADELNGGRGVDNCAGGAGVDIVVTCE